MVYDDLFDAYMKANRKPYQELMDRMQSKFVGKVITPYMKDECFEYYRRLFDSYGLEEFKFRITINENIGSIGFDPVRKIDRLVLAGIKLLSMRGE